MTAKDREVEHEHRLSSHPQVMSTSRPIWCCYNQIVKRGPTYPSSFAALTDWSGLEREPIGARRARHGARLTDATDWTFSGRGKGRGRQPTAAKL